jgi:TatD DNase family protein
MGPALSETRYVGEVGLDAGPRFFKSLDAQKRVFLHVLQRCAEAGGKIITVHSIRSAKAVLDLAETHLPPERGKIVLHWFTGTKSEAKRALELGCYFSINAGMLDNERHAAMVQTIPLDRMLTETDGPSLARAIGPPSHQMWRPWWKHWAVCMLYLRPTWRASFVAIFGRCWHR